MSAAGLAEPVAELDPRSSCREAYAAKDFGFGKVALSKTRWRFPASDGADR
jgi:hypothetical protein